MSLKYQRAVNKTAPRNLKGHFCLLVVQTGEVGGALSEGKHSWELENHLHAYTPHIPEVFRYNTP